MQAHRSKRTSSTATNLLVDLALFAAFLIAASPHFTGVTIHEWLGTALGATVITHLLLHWQWLVAVTRRFFHVPWSSRINYILNTLLFIAFTVIIFTGLMISEALLPLFGIQLPQGFIWHRVHSLASDAAVLIVGLHVALHWRWIVHALSTYVVRPLVGRRPSRPAIAAHSQTEASS